jgi:hypothetical protein
LPLWLGGVSADVREVTVPSGSPGLLRSLFDPRTIFSVRNLPLWAAISIVNAAASEGVMALISSVNTRSGLLSASALAWLSAATRAVSVLDVVIAAALLGLWATRVTRRRPAGQSRT